MAIDYVIDWECTPKVRLSTSGILTRLKARDRAAAIIQLYRDNGDQRAPREMGFEMARRTPDGEEEVRVVIVQELIDEAAQLDPLAEHCQGCPANRMGQPFGCFGAINYPISHAAELWLLLRLPTLDDPLPYLLLRQMITDSPDLGASVASLRSNPGVIFESGDLFARRIEDVQITNDQIFDMLFVTGAILPTYAAMLMLFFGVIARDMNADVLKTLTPATGDWYERFPFQLIEEDDDDESIGAFKNFFAAVYMACGLDVPLSLDA